MRQLQVALEALAIPASDGSGAPRGGTQAIPGAQWGAVRSHDGHCVGFHYLSVSFSLPVSVQLQQFTEHALKA